MLRSKSFSALLVAGAVYCGTGVASLSSAGWCNHSSRPSDRAWRLKTRVSTYVENPQVFRSELRPRNSYRIEFYCVQVPGRTHRRSWHGRINRGNVAAPP